MIDDSEITLDEVTLTGEQFRALIDEIAKLKADFLRSRSNNMKLIVRNGRYVAALAQIANGATGHMDRDAELAQWARDALKEVKE